MIFNEIFLLLQLYLMQNSYLCTQIYRYCMQNIRNIAIIAHVDHGKTTLVDKMLDNNDLERERGITILSKNVSINYKGTKINIIDTPGHSDFGGEVERVLNMADGCILLVDAFEGPMPQTRFVLQKALQIGLKPIVVVNKVDKPNCRPEEVYEMVFDLMFSLEATEDQLDFPVIYGSAKNNWMSTDWKTPTDNIFALLDCIVENIPAPTQLEGTPQMLVTSLDYSSYTGRIAVGRVHRGTLKEGMNVTLVKRNGDMLKSKIKELHVFEGLGRVKTNEVSSGDICALVGIDGFEIGDTVCDFENPEALPPIAIDEPTMSMLFAINDSPFFGKEGKFVTSRHIQDRLTKELDKNLALRVRKSELEDGKWIVSGRGVLHLSVLIETMRRQGFEFAVSRPRVIYKQDENGKIWALWPEQTEDFTRENMKYTYGAMNHIPCLILPEELEENGDDAPVEATVRLGFVNAVKDHFPAERIPIRNVPAEKIQERNMLYTDLKAYLDSFVADCVVNGLDDAKWEKHLKDVEGYRASEWVQWYQDYIDKKF
mgnify:CR=1 FL=1